MNEEIEMNKVKITDMKMCRLGADIQRLATFSAICNGVALSGCMIFQQPDGHMSAVPPKALSGDSEKKAVWFDDKGLRDLFREKALHVYRALAGDDEPSDAVEPADEPEAAGLRRFLGEGERESLGQAIG